MRILDNTGPVQGPFHRELVILDKIINDLKAKLPLGKKPVEEEEESGDIEEQSETSQDATSTDISALGAEEEEETPESNSLVYKIKKKLQGLQKKSGATEEGGDDDEVAKKKKRSKMLQIAIGGGLFLFLISDYIIPTEEAPAPEIKLKPRKRPNKTAAKTEEKPAEVKPEETATAVPTEVTATETTPTTETPSSTIETNADSPVTVESVDVPTDTTTPAIETPTETETPMIAAPETTITEPTVGNTTTVDSVDGNETGKADENITDQILQDLEKQAKVSPSAVAKKEYISPPDYEYRGRGLVYNCQGKHWACVDGPSYKTCEDNSSSVAYLKKRTECHPYNIYETAKGCESMQNRMVSASAKTEFCN